MVRNFTLRELTHSTTADDRCIDNTLPADLEDNAHQTLQMLQYIRDHLSAVAGKDVPIKISSGYRCPPLNVAVGGSKTSDHMKACAVDFVAPAFGTPTQICQELVNHLDGLGIGQLINEFPDRDGWVHVSTVRPTKTVNRVITYTKKGVFPGVRGAH